MLVSVEEIMAATPSLVEFPVDHNAILIFPTVSA